MKKLTSAWEKKNSKTARAGGASLMALSLAACGGEDNTPFSAADVAEAEAAATTAALTAADGVTVYESVDAAVTAGEAAASEDIVNEINTALGTSLTTADDAATIISTVQTSNDAEIAADATTAAEAAAATAAEAAAAAAAESEAAAVSAAEATAAETLAALQATYDALVASNATLQASYDALANPAATTTALASTQDIVSLTTNNDTITGTSTTYTQTDVISDASTTDSDTMTITATADITATPTVVNIENIVFNAAFFAAAGNGLDLNADGITNGTITINHTQVGSSADTAVVTNANGVTIVAGTDVDTLDVSMNADAGTIVNAGDATDVTIRSESGADQTAVFVANGDTALTVVNTAGTMTDLNITATEASVATLTLTGATLDTVTGDSNTTVDFGASIASATAFTITGAAGIVGGANTADLTNVATSVAVEIDTGAASALTVADGASIEYSAVRAAGTNSIIADDVGLSTSSTESEVSITLSDDTTDASSAAGGYSVTLTDSATDGDDEITTLNIAVTGDLDHDTTNDDDLLLVLTDNELATTINITGGAGGVDMATTTDAANDVTINASAVTGSVTYNQTDGVATITTGAGADTILFGAEDVTLNTGAGNDSITVTVVATTAHSVNGGDGTDTFVVDLAAGAADANLTTTTLTGIEVLTSARDAMDFDASQVSGQTYSITNGAGIEIDSANSVDLASIDLSTLTFEDATDVVRVDLTQIATSLTGAQAFTYVGSDAADTVQASANGDNISGGAGIDNITGGAGADTINGDAGADVISGAGGVDTITGGEGIDTITGGDGADIIDLTETTAATDDVNIAVVGASDNIDVITGFTAGLLANGGDTIGFGNATVYTNDTATDYDTGNATLAAAATAVHAANGVDGTVEAISFNYGGNMYVTITDGTDDDTYLATADAIVQLVGVDAADLIAANFIA